MEGNVPAIVLDNGSTSCRVGFSGEDAPREIFPSVVGRCRCNGRCTINIPGMGVKHCYVGDEGERKAGILTLRNPIEGGRIVNWSNMEEVWRHAILDRLQTSPTDHPILLSETDHLSKNDRPQIAQVLFESLDMPAFYISSQAVLSLYATGRVTGVVLHSSESSTDAVPVYEGFALRHAIGHLDIAGRDLTEALARKCESKGFYPIVHRERKLFHDIKKKAFQVIPRMIEETPASDPVEVPYCLPDGQTIMIGDEGHRLPESLFTPSLAGLQQDGIPELVRNAIKESDHNISRSLYEHIVLSGGNTLIVGFHQRFKEEIKSSSPSFEANVVGGSREHRAEVWIGGATLARLSTFQKLCILRKEYSELGETIVKRKIF